MSLALIVAKSGESMKSGPIGLAVILVLCVAAYFLFKSMSKHLRRVREQFPVEDAPEHSARRDLPERSAGPAPLSAKPPAKPSKPAASTGSSVLSPGSSAGPAMKPPAVNQPSDGDSSS